MRRSELEYNVKCISVSAVSNQDKLPQIPPHNSASIYTDEGLQRIVSSTGSGGHRGEIKDNLGFGGGGWSLTGSATVCDQEQASYGAD